MPKSTPYTDLQEAILTLEKEQALRGQLLKEQVKTTYESLKPLNFIKNTLSNFAESTEVRHSLFDIAVALATGFIGRKVLAGNRRETPLRNAGILLLSGLNSYISSNPEVIRAFAQTIVAFFHKAKPSDQATEE
jgi:hypothetical protein